MKTYLAFRGEAVGVELDTHEVSQQIDIEEGEYVKTVRNIMAPSKLFSTSISGSKTHNVVLQFWRFMMSWSLMLILKHLNVKIGMKEKVQSDESWWKNPISSWKAFSFLYFLIFLCLRLPLWFFAYSFVWFLFWPFYVNWSIKSRFHIILELAFL